MLGTPTTALPASPAAKPARCSCCDILLRVNYGHPLGDVSAPDDILILPIDAAGRCPTCSARDASVCPNCNVHVYADERDAAGRCGDCAASQPASLPDIDALKRETTALIQTEHVKRVSRLPANQLKAAILDVYDAMDRGALPCWECKRTHSGACGTLVTAPKAVR